jgi:hypothetical protein
LADIVFVLIALAFFALAAGYVSLCDRIIGPDPELESPEPAASPIDLDDDPELVVTP